MTLAGVPIESILAWSLAFLRASAFLLASPVLGGPGVPVRARLVGGAALAIVLFPFASADFGLGETWGGADLIAAATAEVGVGLAMGFAARLVYSAIQVAAALAESTMGLSSAHVFDPFSQETEGLLSRFQGAVASLALLAADAHHGLIAALARSYRAIPAGSGLPDPAQGLALSGLAAEMIGAGVRLAAPLALAMLVVSVWTALLARAAPQMNAYFAIGAVVSVAAGLGLLALVAPAMTQAASWMADAMAHTAASVAAGS